MSNESLLELAVKSGKKQVQLALLSLSDACLRESRYLLLFEDKRMLTATGDLKARFDELEEAVDQLRKAWEELQYAKH